MDGIIIINKPQGFTSHDVVNIVKKTLNISKVGHTGTLDPNATGVLPILIGKATKISKYLIEHDKEYIATISFGEKKDTGDSEGETIEKDENAEAILRKLNNKDIEKILDSFLGKQKQMPPIYSAIKVGGKKAYEYARKGQEVNLKPRDIEIYNIELLNKNNNLVTFKVLCSKGTYIRTLCEDIAKKCGTIGYMSKLIRTRVNKFKIENAINLEDVKKCKIITIEDIFIDNEKIELPDKKVSLFLNGVKLKYELTNGIYRIYNNNKFLGLGILQNNLLKRDVILE